MMGCCSREGTESQEITCGFLSCFKDDGEYVKAETPLLPLGSSQRESLTLRGKTGPAEQAVPTSHSETQIWGAGTSATPLGQKYCHCLQNCFVS